MKKCFAVCLTMLSLLTGCASNYIPPGAKADLQAFAPAAIAEGFAAKPVATFPASIAAVRLQAASYGNYYLAQNGGAFGSGRASVVMTREAEEPGQVARIASLPQVSGLVALNRMLIPPKLESDRDIRTAAARLQADMVLLYTFDTAFYDHDLAKPLSVITLGFSPTCKIAAVTTASALLLDTRSGYVYAAYETTKKAGTLSTSWGSGDAADGVRRDNERAAFTQLVDEIVASWPKLLQRYAAQAH
ncbi:MAG: hypothetical protein ABIT83_19520 [Massilia sp.]